MSEQDPDRLMRAYSAALDEVYRLRRALAYEAEVTAAHIDYKTFPKSRRGCAEEQIARMEASARGESETAYAGKSHRSLDSALQRAGAPRTLTRHQFEEQRGLR